MSNKPATMSHTPEQRKAWHAGMRKQIKPLRKKPYVNYNAYQYFDPSNGLIGLVKAHA